MTTLDERDLRAELARARREAPPFDPQKEAIRARLFGALRPGDRIGRFVVADVLGQGGMGTVYEARDDKLGRRVAIKLLRRKGAERDTLRLEREAMVLASLSHPNVVQVLELGEADGQTFLVMERISGQTLAAWQRARPRRWTEHLAAYRQAARGLAAAHAQGIVHRDFKPSNCIIDEHGCVKVLDFGLAHVLRDDVPATEPDAIGLGGSTTTTTDGLAADHRLTRTGSTLGTPAYMPPEQRHDATTDPRSDQFAFCVSLYEALYREHPFTRTGAPELSAPPREPKVPRWLRRIVLRGLTQRPEDRWPSMKALLDAIDHGRRRAEVRRATWAGSGLLGLALVSGGVLLPPPSSRAVPTVPSEHDARVESEPASSAVVEELERIRVLDRSGKHHEGLTRLARLVPSIERMGDPRPTIEALQLEGRLHVSAGNDERAEACFARAIELAVHHGLEHAALEGMAAMINLEGIEHQRTEAALRLGTRAEAVARRAGVDPVALAKVVTAVAQVLTLRGQPSEAIVRYSEALALLESRLGTGHVELVEVLDGLGAASLQHGDLERAEATQRRALAIRTTWKGADDPGTAYQRVNLGAVLHARGKRDEAAMELQQALDMLVRVDPPDHKRIAHAHVDLGAVLSKLGRQAEAEAQLRSALERWELAGQRHHPRAAETRFNLARVLEKQGRSAQALEQYRWVQEILDHNERSLRLDELHRKAGERADRLRSPVAG